MIAERFDGATGAQPSTLLVPSDARERVRLRVRIAHGLRRFENWVQLVRFATVGASGYVVNLIVFAALVGGVGHRAAAASAFSVAVFNNFTWNRVWTFESRGRGSFQALRFLVVSVLAFLVSLAVLEMLIGAGAPPVPAQVAAIATAMPVNFVGNKVWVFAARARP